MKINISICIDENWKPSIPELIWGVSSSLLKNKFKRDKMKWHIWKNIEWDMDEDKEEATVEGNSLWIGNLFPNKDDDETK